MNKTRKLSAGSDVLAVRDLLIRRGNKRVLGPITWQVKQGENWVILGPNGSGKSSLLQAITGYFFPTAGEIELLDHRWGQSDWRSLREHIGVVGPAISEQVDPLDNAMELVVGGALAMVGLWGKPPAGSIKRAKSLLAEFDISELANRPWQTFSQGERQRVLIARALAADLSLLILDEPCSGLDPLAREEFLAEVERLTLGVHRPPVVMITHHVEEITPAFTHALLLNDGKILQQGPIEETITEKSLSKLFGRRVSLDVASLPRCFSLQLKLRKIGTRPR